MGGAHGNSGSSLLFSHAYSQSARKVSDWPAARPYDPPCHHVLSGSLRRLFGCGLAQPTRFHPPRLCDRLSPTV